MNLQCGHVASPGVGLVSSPDLIRAGVGFGSGIETRVGQSSLVSFLGLQSPNAVESLVKLLRKMTSGRRWVDVG